MQPAIRYAANGDINLAYQTHGEGAIDIVFVPPWNSNLEQYWDQPACVRFFDGLASFSRLILFDKRGAGLSDPVPGASTPEDLREDVAAVMDAAGSSKAALFGGLWGGPISAMFAAKYPERTQALVLYGTFATRVRGTDYPWAPPSDTREVHLDEFVAGWTEGRDLAVLGPSVAGDAPFRQWWARMHRMSASPGALRAEVRMMSTIDVRDVLGSIQVPTLILHRSGDKMIDPGNGRFLAASIPGAQYVELPGEDHLPFVGDVDRLLGEVEEFLTGARRAAEDQRSVLTVMFTDIVGSTDLAAELGDRRWRDLIATHDDIVRKQLRRFRGREIKTMGDGFLAIFEGPTRAIQAACAIRDATSRAGINLRAGLHAGECDVVGLDIGGLAVAIAARVVAKARSGEILVSGTVKELVTGSGRRFADRGTHTLKGVPDEWRLYAVED